MDIARFEFLTNELTRIYEKDAKKGNLDQLTKRLKEDIALLKKLFIEGSLQEPAPLFAHQILKKFKVPKDSPSIDDFKVVWEKGQPNPNLTFVDRISLKGKEIAWHEWEVTAFNRVINQWGEKVDFDPSFEPRFDERIKGGKKLTQDGYKILIYLTDPELCEERFRKMLDELR